MNSVCRFAIVWMLAVSAMAEVPSGTYPIGELEKAKAETLERKKYGKGSVALDELSPASRGFAENLAGTGEISEVAGSGDPESEEWTSSDGKAVSARFVSLKGGELTIETAKELFHHDGGLTRKRYTDLMGELQK